MQLFQPRAKTEDNMYVNHLVACSYKIFEWYLKT